MKSCPEVANPHICDAMPKLYAGHHRACSSLPERLLHRAKMRRVSPFLNLEMKVMGDIGGFCT